MGPSNAGKSIGSFNSTHPWVIIYPGIGTEQYLTLKDYKKVVKDLDNDFVPVSEGRILGTRFQRLVPNPNYIDKTEVSKTRKREEIKREYAEMKEQGKFKNIEDFLKWKKEQK